MPRIQNYIDKLLVLFETCEDLESIDDLHKLYTITKAISKLLVFLETLTHLMSFSHVKR